MARKKSGYDRFFYDVDDSKSGDNQYIRNTVEWLKLMDLYGDGPLKEDKPNLRFTGLIEV